MVLPSLLTQLLVRSVLKLLKLGLLLAFSVLPLRLAEAQTGYLSPSAASADENLVILIHGWNPSDSPDMFADADGDDGWFFDLKAALATATAGSDWSVRVFHWEDEASTGPIFDNEWVPPVVTIPGYLNAASAASAGFSNGIKLHSLLKDLTKLRRVHLIAHSAGSWVARETAAKLVNSNPYVLVQVTLLDPFIPGLPGGVTTSLTKQRMSDLASLPQQNRIYRLENYFCDDISDYISGGPGNTTSQSFGWRTRDINLDIAYTTHLIADPRVYGGAVNGHSEPIHFMGDSVSSAGASVPSRQAYAPWPGTYSSYGFHRSLFYERFAFPRFSTQPALSNGTITTTVANSGGVSYEWFKNGATSPLPGANSATLNVSPPSAGVDRYVLRAWKSSDAHLQAFSQEVAVPALALPRPRIDSIEHPYLTGKSLPQTTRIAILGGNFTASSRLVFNDGVNPSYSDRVPINWNPGRLEYDIAVGLETATWTVQVTVGGVPSNTAKFYVTAPAGSKTLTGLAIEGPATVNSGGSAPYAARAHYSDGSNKLVTAAWSENSSSASISSSGGLLSANTVSSNRTVTVTADYTEGGIPQSATTEVTIVTSSGSGGSQTTDVIVNGGFESGTTPWAPVGYAGVVALSYPRTGTSYAYLGDTNNATGAVSQFFPIPANMTDAAFEFYLNPTSYEGTTTEKFDKMKVSLSTANDQHVADIAEFSNLDKRTAGSYIKKSYNLTSKLNAYKGQSLFLVFSATTDYADSTIFRIDDVKLNITTSAPVSLVDLVIGGDSAVPANNLENYEAFAVFSDGTTQRVSSNSWSDNSSVCTISSAGDFQTGNVTTTTTVTISTSYSFNGHTENASKTVTVFPPSSPPVFDRLAIEGPGSVDEGSYVNVSGKAIFTDGSVQTVSPTWSLVSNWASINSNGRVDAEEVSGDRSMTVQATHTIGGRTRSASHELLIIDSDPEPSLEFLEIIGAPSLAEGQFESYEARAHFSDGSSRYVSPAWQENSPATTISSYGLLTASPVSADTPVTLSATYSTGGTQRSASLVVTVVNVPDTQGPGLSITSPLSGFLSPTRLLTVTGVASDAGLGNNGVSAVSVNGVPANGGAASSTGVATWSAAIELAEGSNPIVVTARDALGNVSSSSIQVSWQAGTPVPAFAWAKSGGGGGDDRLNGLEVDKQGNVFALLQYAGNFRIQGVELTGSGTLESALLMLSPDGSLRWALDIKSPSVVVATSLAVSPSGHSLVAGYFGTSCRLGGIEVFSKGARDGFLAKVDPGGRVEWVRTFGSPTTASADRCFVTSCALTPDGAAVLGGYFLGSLAFGSEVLSPGNLRNPFVAKYTATGSTVWISRGTGTGNIRAMTIALGATGSIAVGGDLENGSLSWGGQSLAADASRDAYAALLDPAGQVQWLRGIQSSAGMELTGLALDSAGALVASGHFQGSLDLQAALLQSRGAQDVVVAKLDPSGNRAWLKQLGSLDWDDSYDLKLNDDGMVLITGSLSGQGQFAGSSYGVAEGWEPYVTAYSPAGEELGLRLASSLTPGSDLGFGTQVASDWSGNFYCGGIFTGSLSFGATTLVASENVDGVYDLFLSKLGLASLAMPELRVGGIGPQIELLWPAGWDHWVLESSPTLGPAASWQVVSNLPVLENGMLKVRPGIDGMKRFYRLRQR